MAPFKFLIDGSPLYIHSDLIARHSAPLHRMIHGQRSAVIDGLGEGVFERFICWAYTGAYSAADFSEDRDVIAAHQPKNAVDFYASESEKRPKAHVAAQGGPSGIGHTLPPPGTVPMGS